MNTWTRDDRDAATTFLSSINDPTQRGFLDLLVGHPDELVGRLADRMVAAGVGRVPIVAPEDGRVVGMVARKDLLRVRATLLAEESYRAASLRWRVQARRLLRRRENSVRGLGPRLG